MFDDDLYWHWVGGNVGGILGLVMDVFLNLAVAVVMLVFLLLKHVLPIVITKIKQSGLPDKIKSWLKVAWLKLKGVPAMAYSGTSKVYDAFHDR